MEVKLAYEVAGAVLLGLISLAVWWRLSRGPAAWIQLLCFGSGKRLPPVQGGWLPWLGCALPFGKQPVTYIKETHKKFGDVFTLQVAGKRMTFIMEPNLYNKFFTSSSVDFIAAILPICKGVGISPRSLLSHLTQAIDFLKGRLSADTSVLCTALGKEFYQDLASYGQYGEKDLMNFVREVMFDCVVRELFGPDNVPASKEDMRCLMKDFIRYDQDFEYGADLPGILLPEWHKTKLKFLKMFKMMGERLCDRQTKDKASSSSSRSVLEELLVSVVDEESMQNYALLFLWASQSNAIPVVFWALCLILSHPESYQLAREEVQNVSFCAQGGAFQPLEEASLKKMTYIKRCLLEAVRLYAPGIIIRKVVKNFSIEDYMVPAGHLLLLSPYWSHRNEKCFPEPEIFKPERWSSVDLDKNHFLPGFIGFGGGRYQCPGRRFALMEMHLFLVMVLSMFKLDLQDAVPQPVLLILLQAAESSIPERV